ncbi:hypothetical protein ACHHYP_20358 [Achlya hypogyna]|uniref:Uncharacterized protein n=1 Tax=Achlya hypogyna TaxID=1202772 RepID=A0A1V9ZL24_ACHHY|nr:hypothetical protein ACHHYP_20358 [Achlya hypogyna]
MVTRAEIAATLAALRAEKDAAAEERDAKDRADRDHTRGLLKIVALESEFLDEMIAFDEDCKLNCARNDLRQHILELESEYQAAKYTHAGEKDKRHKHALLAKAKAKRDEGVAAAKAQLAALGDQSAPSLPAKKPPALTTTQVKEMTATIKRLWREKQSLPDPNVAYLEIGKLLRQLGEEDKAIAYVQKAIGPNEKATNSMLAPTQEERRKHERIEHKRVRRLPLYAHFHRRQMWEARSILMHYYLRHGPAAVCEEHMTAYLALAQGDQRPRTLIYLDKLLARVSGVDQIGQATVEGMTHAVLIRRSLGCLPDLRLRILTELNDIFPHDACTSLSLAHRRSPTSSHVLEALASLKVRLADYAGAGADTRDFALLPEVARLPLFADVLELAPTSGLGARQCAG